MSAGVPVGRLWLSSLLSPRRTPREDSFSDIILFVLAMVSAGYLFSMLCDVCHEREATIFIVDVRDRRHTKQHLCEFCDERQQAASGSADVPTAGWTSYSPAENLSGQRPPAEPEA